MKPRTATEFNELANKLQTILDEQDVSSKPLARRMVAGIEATYDKHEALGLVLDFCGPDIERLFESIR